jgi:hypothetical protein
MDVEKDWKDIGRVVVYDIDVFKISI